ncbi:MAG: PocR ligand-binding domain-containing protein [Actinomycetes bacterium]
MTASEGCRLEDLLDIPRLQELFDSLNDAYPFPSAIVDNEGHILTATAWQDVCTRFHRVDEVSELECLESDRYILTHIDEADPSVVYRCPHGMVDAATPIIVDGRHLGSVFVGQLFLEAPDLAFFRAQAAKYGFDEDAYLEAVARVPVLTQGQFDRYLAVMRRFAEIFASMALDRLREGERADVLRAAEEAARKSAELYRVLTEGMQDVVWVLDTETMYFRYVSPSVQRLRGFTAEEIVAAPVDAALTVAAGEGLKALVRERAAAFREARQSADEFYVDEVEQPCKDGSSVWTEVITSYSVSPDTGHVEARGVTRDSGARRRAEESLRQNEQRMIRAQSIAHVGNWELDVGMRTMWASAEAFRIYGLERTAPTMPLELAEGATLPEYRPGLDAALGRLIAGQGEYDEEFEIRRANDGQVRVVHSTGELVRDEDGAPASIVGALQDVTELKAAEREALEAAARLRRMVDGAVAAMGALVETRDPYTAGHQRRVTQLVVALAAELGIEGAACETLRLAAELHDIGRVAVPAEILTRPGRLSETEFALVKVHPAAGADILAPLELGAPVADIVRRHHERLDGSGYPDGLLGEAIPREARIIAVADVVEAMASHRPYRPALGVEAALAEIAAGAGRLYDADVAAACARVFAAGFAFSE